MSTPPDTWSEPFKVRSYELTPHRELSAPALCNYLQEAASRHAQELGASIDDLADHNLTWVLARLDLLLESTPRWRDALVVETWPSEMRGFVARREFVVRRDGRVTARATSKWLVIDLDRRRPARLPAELRRIAVPDKEPVLPGSSGSLPELVDADRVRRFQVDYGDLDINRHVNHVSYIEWAIETLPTEFHEGHRLAELETDFRSEIHYPAEITAEAGAREQDGEQRVLHRLITSGGVEAARLRTRWVRREP